MNKINDCDLYKKKEVKRLFPLQISPTIVFKRVVPFST